MFFDDMSGIVIGGIACLAVGGALGWQLRRRKSVVSPKAIMSKDRRDPCTGAPVPNDHPASGAVKKSEAVRRFDEVNVARPTMLVVTTDPKDASAGELFVQRSFKIDRTHWKPIDVSWQDKRALDGLFVDVCKLAWVPGSAFERHIYAVSFAPSLEQRLKAGGESPLANQHDLKVCAINHNGVMLGEPMKLAGGATGESCGLPALWRILNPRTRPHALAQELEDELYVLKTHAADLEHHVSALTARNWMMRVDAVEKLASSVGGITEHKTARLEFSEQVKNLAMQVRGDSYRIDLAISERTKTLQSLDDADVALQHAISYMYVRELAVRLLRVCALLCVIGGESFEIEVECVNRIVQDLNEFPDINPLIRAVGKFTHKELDRAGRTMNDIELNRMGAVKRHAEELIKLHDGYVKQLRDEINAVQDRIDQCLLAQGRLSRYAVRVDDYGHVEEVYVLQV